MIADMSIDEEPQLSSIKRRERIADILAGKRSVRVAELSVLFQVSEVTIRNDLEVMSKQGRLIRDRGGAIARAVTFQSTLFEQRAQESLAEKSRIGCAAAKLLVPGETVIMDAGSTMMQMAKHVEVREGLTVITNALNVAVQLMSSTGVHVILAGGSISPETISTVGVIAERDIDEFRVDKLFLSTHALNAIDGLLDTSPEVARVKQSMIRAARQIILLADSSKWGRTAFARVAPLSAIHTIISDTGLTSSAREEISELDISLILV
jgi:DeoR family transcriptional regulator, aga operon transcriptional repressor